MEWLHFKPEEALTFKSVMSVRSSLYKALMSNDHDNFRLDLSAVTHCDSAGLALLIEVKKWCKQSNKRFEVVGASPKTQSLAEFCGIKTILERV